MLTADRRIDRRILLEADALEADGWNVRIVAMPLDEDDAAPDPRVVRLGISTRQNPKEAAILGIYRKTRRLLPMNSTAMQWMKAFTWRHLIDQERFYLDLFLAEALRHPSSIVVAHDLPMLPVACAAARSFGAKVVYDSHELFSEHEFSEPEKRRWRAIETKYFGEAAEIITVNQTIAAELEKRYDRNGVHVILNAEKPFDPKEKPSHLRDNLSIDKSHVIGLFQGGLSDGRNLGQLIDAMRILGRDDVHLVFLGDGQLKQQLKQKASASGLLGNVHFLDAVPQQTLLSYTASADFGVIPYIANCLNTEYCTPNKLFEFIAAGVPIVSSNLPELRRFVGDFKLGLLVNFEDPHAVAGALELLVRDTAAREGFKANTLAARQQISWDVEAVKLRAIFSPLRSTARNTN